MPDLDKFLLLGDQKGHKMPRVLWMEQLATDMQHAFGEMILCEVDDLREVFENLATKIPEVSSAADRRLLRDALVEFTVTGGGRFHAKVHRDRPDPCGFEPAGLLLQFFGESLDDPHQAFRVWGGRFLDELLRAHPLRLSVRVSRMIRRDCRGPLNVPDIAGQLNVTHLTLARIFHRDFGMSMREYQARCRVYHVLKTIDHDKVDAAAREAGFGSRKNFHRTFRKLTGMTPRQYRQLPPGARSQVVELAWIALHRGLSNAGPSAVS